MNAKENALRIIRFDHPEWVATGYPAHTIGYTGCGHEGYNGGGHHLPAGEKWTDIWGTEWHKEHEGVMGFPRGNPLANLVPAMKTYSWPDPNDERICGQITTQAAGWNRAESFLDGSHRDTLWEKSYMLVGMEDLMCYFYTEPNAVKELLHHIMDFQLGIAKRYLDIGVEIVSMSDDLGTQCGLLLAPEIVHEFLVPEYRRLFQLYKRHNVLIKLHSCGHIMPMLTTLMELGVDVLDPIQATANDVAEVRRITQGRMTLHGGFGADVITQGPAEVIRRQVAEQIWQLGQDGGYFCCPDHYVPWPEAHYNAFKQAVEEFGRYPLRSPEHISVG
jgi:uroporphyrinogen decarboxylase